MPDTLELLKLTRIVNDDGTSVWVEIGPDLADVIRRLDATAHKREQRRKRREKTFSELNLDENRVPEGNPWEGPRYHFTWLVGESRTWVGDPRMKIEGEWYCGFCLGARLPSHAYCLGCDRCGRDREIPTVGAEELEKKRSRTEYRPGAYRGGKK